MRLFVPLISITKLILPHGFMSTLRSSWVKYFTIKRHKTVSILFFIRIILVSNNELSVVQEQLLVNTIRILWNKTKQLFEKSSCHCLVSGLTLTINGTNNSLTDWDTRKSVHGACTEGARSVHGSVRSVNGSPTECARSAHGACTERHGACTEGGWSVEWACTEAAQSMKGARKPQYHHQSTTTTAPPPKYYHHSTTTTATPPQYHQHSDPTTAPTSQPHHHSLTTTAPAP